MKLLKKYLSTAIIYLIISTLYFTSCNKQTETVFITPNISVELPVNYKKYVSKSLSSDITDSLKKIEMEHDTYRAKINNDEIFIGNLINNDFKTFNIKEKKEKLIPNLNGFVRGFNGYKLMHKDTIIKQLVQSDFTFEIDQNDTLSIIYGRLIIQDSYLLFFNYKTKLPINSSSIINKDDFFNSIKYKN